jgi:hypothetical protein
MRVKSVTLAIILLISVPAFAAAAEAGANPGAAFDPPTTGSLSEAPALRPAFGEPAVRQAVPRAPEEARAAPAWCGTGRIVGSGLGFCEIN